jgi:hypothetical protein
MGMLRMKVGEISSLDPTSYALSIRAGGGDVLLARLGDGPPATTIACA